MEIKGKKIYIFKAENHNAPLLILNSYIRSGGEIYKKCKETGCPDFTLVEVSGLNWEDDMSMGAIPSISEDAFISLIDSIPTVLVLMICFYIVFIDTGMKEMVYIDAILWTLSTI